jgi:hypothetical protein
VRNSDDKVEKTVTTETGTLTAAGQYEANLIMSDGRQIRVDLHQYSRGELTFPNGGRMQELRRVIKTRRDKLFEANGSLQKKLQSAVEQYALKYTTVVADFDIWWSTLKSMLEVDPSQRISAVQALKSLEAFNVVLERPDAPSDATPLTELIQFNLKEFLPDNHALGAQQTLRNLSNIYTDRQTKIPWVLYNKVLYNGLLSSNKLQRVVPDAPPSSSTEPEPRTKTNCIMMGGHRTRSAKKRRSSRLGRKQNTRQKSLRPKSHS